MRKKSKLKSFLIIVFAIIMIYVVVASCLIGYKYATTDEDTRSSESWVKTNINLVPSIFKAIPKKTTFLIMGLDGDQTRTDTIMAGCYDSVAQKISIVSVPRDTYVIIPDERYEIMKNEGTAQHYEMKLNGIYHHSPEGRKVEFAKATVEELLDVKFDYYAVVNFEAFQYIIDSIGGIEYNVKDRIYYSDPTQDLVIDLYPGMQVLDGEDAEGLVRYRSGYARADLDRVEVQRDFLNVFINTVLDKDNIKSNPQAYLKTVLEYVDTNAGVTDIVKYLKNIDKIKNSTFEGYTLPGRPKMIGDASFYVQNEEESKILIDEVFKSESEKASKAEPVDSFDKNILVLNGGYTKGMAGKCKEFLEEQNFNIADISDYSGEKTEHTRIFVAEDGFGQDIQKLIPNSKIIVDENETQGYDIVVVIGTDDRF